MKTGTPIFDGLAATNIVINLIPPSASMEVTAAFINTQTGTTIGWTKHTQWSPTTIAAMEALQAAVEGDIARKVFGAKDPSTPAGFQPSEGGIGEFLTQEKQV